MEMFGLSLPQYWHVCQNLDIYRDVGLFVFVYMPVWYLSSQIFLRVGGNKLCYYLNLTLWRIVQEWRWICTYFDIGLNLGWAVCLYLNWKRATNWTRDWVCSSLSECSGSSALHRGWTLIIVPTASHFTNGAHKLFNIVVSRLVNCDNTLFSS